MPNRAPAYEAATPLGTCTRRDVFKIDPAIRQRHATVEDGAATIGMAYGGRYRVVPAGNLVERKTQARPIALTLLALLMCSRGGVGDLLAVERNPRPLTEDFSGIMPSTHHDGRRPSASLRGVERQPNGINAAITSPTEFVERREVACVLIDHMTLETTEKTSMDPATV